ncbi:MAG TPA: 2-hydroxyacid dehydrogenase [Solirubrobacterales bacterium]
MPINVWIPEEPASAELGELPESVGLNVVPRHGSLPPGIESAEFLVPPFGSRRVLEAMPRMNALRVVQVKSAGVDWILPHVPAGVTLCNARGVRDAPVAEWVMAAILDVYKLMPRFQRQQSEGRWEYATPDELAGSRALIVGYGSIGRAVERRLEAFEVEVDRLARRPRPGVAGAERLAELLPHADIVVLLTPATASTRGLCDATTLARMKPGALLVNAARGSVVDTDALVEAVSAERIRVALDVTDPEPLPAGHPLWSLPGVLLTPHVAGDSDLAERRVYRFVAEQIRRHLRGEPLLNVVEPG